MAKENIRLNSLASYLLTTNNSSIIYSQNRFNSKDTFNRRNFYSKQLLHPIFCDPKSKKSQNLKLTKKNQYNERPIIHSIFQTKVKNLQFPKLKKAKFNKFSYKNLNFLINSLSKKQNQKVIRVNSNNEVINKLNNKINFLMKQENFFSTIEKINTDEINESSTRVRYKIYDFSENFVERVNKMDSEKKRNVKKLDTVTLMKSFNLSEEENFPFN